MHDPRPARSVVYLRHAPYIRTSLPTRPTGQRQDCWYKSMLIPDRALRWGGMVRVCGSPPPPSPPASECNRDGSTRFFTLNTDPSRIKQELFLFILKPAISSASISHFHQFSEAVFGFWYFPIISKTFKETNTVDQNVAGDILTKKFIHFLTFWNGANLRWISFLKTLVSNSKLTF